VWILVAGVNRLLSSAYHPTPEIAYQERKKEFLREKSIITIVPVLNRTKTVIYIITLNQNIIKLNIE